MKPVATQRELALKFVLMEPKGQQEVLALLRANGFQCDPQTRRRITDLYLDTFEWTLWKKSRALRFRRVQGRQEYTLKRTESLQNGVADRSSLSFEMPAVPSQPREIPDQALRKVIEEIIYPRALLEQLTVKTEREEFRLRLEPGNELGLVFDQSRFIARGLNRRRRAARVFELKAELLHGEPKVLDVLSNLLKKEIACVPSSQSKLEMAIQQLGIKIPSKAPPSKWTVFRSDLFGIAVWKILAFQYERFLEYLRGIPLDLDTEFVHQARVASRRMRSALGLFKDAVPTRRRDALVKELKWIAAELGRVRDLDVLLLKLPDFPEKIESAKQKNVSVLRRLIQERRRVEIEKLSQVLQSARFRRFEKLASSLVAFQFQLSKRSPSFAAAQKVEDVASVLILKRFESVLKFGRAVLKGPRLKAFHRVRIEAKKLRYACEFLDSAYEGRLQPFIKTIAKIQDCLGELQDTVFTRELLDQIRKEWQGQAIAPDLWFLLGEIYQYQGEIARKKKKQFKSLWHDFATWNSFPIPMVVKN